MNNEVEIESEKNYDEIKIGKKQRLYYKDKWKRNQQN